MSQDFIAEMINIIIVFLSHTVMQFRGIAHHAITVTKAARTSIQLAVCTRNELQPMTRAGRATNQGCSLQRQLQSAVGNPLAHQIGWGEWTTYCIINLTPLAICTT